MARTRTIGGVTLGLVGLLLLAGIVLFLIPEPATSGIGITLIVVALVLWVVQQVL